MPRYIGRHPTEPERDSVDNLKDVDITTTSPSATDNLLVYDNATGVYKPGSAAASGGGGGNLSAPTDTDNFDDGALLGSDSTLARTKFYNKSTGAYQATDPGGGNGIAVVITLDGTNPTGFTTSDDLTESVDKLNELMFNIGNNHYVRHAKFVPKDGPASTATVTGQANIGDTVYFHIPKELFNSTDGNVTKCDVLDWGDGTAAETNKQMQPVTNGGGAKYVSHQYDDAVDSGNGYTVKIRLYNDNAISGTIGSSICFQLTDLLTSFTTKPSPVLQYQFTNRAGTQTIYTSTSPVDVDEDNPSGANAGKTVQLDFRVKDNVAATPFHYFAMKFTSGSTISYYPTALDATKYAYSDNAGNQIQNNWEQVTTVTSAPNVRHDFSHRLDFTGTAKQDEQYSIELKCWASTADQNDAVGILSAPITMKLFKDYTSELTYTLTGYKAGTSGNNNEAADNQTWATRVGKSTPSDYNSEGYVIESGVATLASGSNIGFNNTYNTKIQFNYTNNKNNYNSTTKDFTNLTTSHIIILRKTSNSGGDETRAINAKIYSGGHSLSPFDSVSGDNTFTIQDDPRADFTAVSNPAPELSTGSTNTKGYLFTTYKNTTLNNFDFTNTSVNTNAYKWDFDNDGSQDSTTESPTGETPYSSTGSYGVKLIATGTNSEIHHKASAADDDTEIKPNMLEILATPTTSLPQTLSGQSMTLDSTGNQPKLCSDTTDNSNGDASISGGDSVTRRTAAFVQATKIGDFISAFPGPGYADMNCVVKGYVNGDSTNNEKTFTTSYSNYDAGTNNGTQGALVISEEADEVTTTIPKGLGRKFKATVQATVSAGVNSYKLGHVRGSAAETNSNVLDFVYDDGDNVPTITGTPTVTISTAGTQNKVDGINYIKGGGGTQLTLASFGITGLTSQCYYGGNDAFTFKNNSGTVVGNEVSKPHTDIREGGTGIATVPAKNLNVTTGSVQSITLNPTTGGGYNATTKFNVKNVKGTSTDKTVTQQFMYWTGTPGNQGDITLTNNGSMTARTYDSTTGNKIVRVKGLSGNHDGAGDDEDNPTIGTESHPFKNSVWVETDTNNVREALSTYIGSGYKWEYNVTDYSGKLPVGPDRSTGTQTYQYVTYCVQLSGFQGTNVNIKVNGTNLDNFDSQSFGHKYMYINIVGESGNAGAAGASTNGWLDANKSAGTDNGCRNAAYPYNTSGEAVQLDMGSMSGNNTNERNALIRFRLSSGQSITSFEFKAYSTAG